MKICDTVKFSTEEWQLLRKASGAIDILKPSDEQLLAIHKLQAGMACRHQLADAAEVFQSLRDAIIADIKTLPSLLPELRLTATKNKYYVISKPEDVLNGLIDCRKAQKTWVEEAICFLELCLQKMHKDVVYYEDSRSAYDAIAEMNKAELFLSE